MASKKEMEVVKGLDVERYMGRWYEIASFPSRFQPKNGANTRATYTLNDDGTVHVLNETWTDGKRGYIEGTAYKADPNSDEAKLKVKFYVPPFLPIIPVVGDYWVLFLDDDYTYALIGGPARKFLWVCLDSILPCFKALSNSSISSCGRGYMDNILERRETTGLWYCSGIRKQVHDIITRVLCLFFFLQILCRQNHMDDEIYNRLVEKAKEEGYDVSKLHETPQSDPPPEEEGAKDTKGIWWIKSILGK
uniref:Apolipoprotein d n=1 Tax=Rhizophora mucronata TaxID=61149 RepID=A0A2P2IXI0_RHIMU